VAADREQQLVISAGGFERIVVEAGPGAGKTNTATERVLRLLETGLAPSRIVLLSFTRAAVSELRKRLGERLASTPGVSMVQIHTFDSYAAHILLLAGAKTGGNHDATVQTATRMLKARDPLVMNLVEPLEHLIIDEAQDLVGPRRAFCEALIRQLRQPCGVTVFGDFAQAIYGYQATGSESGTLLDLVQSLPGFRSMQITGNHRARTEQLASLFQSARAFLRSAEPLTRGSYFELRDLIEAGAVETGIGDFAGHHSTTRGVILTRYRSSLLSVAESMRMSGRPFRIRLNDRPLRIEPWLGACLGGLDPDTRVDRDAFVQLHEGLENSISRTADECWDILRDLDGMGRSHVTVGRIAEGLEYPPPELVRDHEGRSGPLLSTVHAFKGRDADRVLMLLHPERRMEGVDWSEEARILYVGATRASHELRTGRAPTGNFYSIGKPERHWRPRQGYREIEIGLEGDLVEWDAFVRSVDAGSVQLLLDTIWRAGANGSLVTAVPSGRDQLMLLAPEDGTPVGLLGRQFTEVLRDITGTPDEAELPELSGVAITGATTVVVAGKAGRRPALGLQPLLGGFARVARQP